MSGAAEPAEDRILDGAEKAFERLGVSAAGMAEIAEAAGCSRGTLYRYFENRHALHLAYVKRTGLRIMERVGAEVASIGSPEKRLAAYVLATLREVRARPGTAAWFDPGARGLAARMSQTPEVVETLMEAFAADPERPARRSRERDLRARWLVRAIVSLLADPPGSAREERALVERFLVPSLLQSPGSKR